MIIKITIAGTDCYIDTNVILYGYNNSGLELVLSDINPGVSPISEVFENNAASAVSFPVYADFVTDNAPGFLEVTHATLTNICLNVSRILRLEAIDSSNTTVMFDNMLTVPVSVSLSTLLTSISTALIGVHNDLSGLQGGTAGEYNHITNAQLVVLGNTSGTNSGNETVNTIGALINGATSATPNDTDLVMSVESSVAKKNTWTQIKAFLKTYFDAIYATVANLALKANIASPTFTGTVTIPNGSDLGTPTTLVATNASGTAPSLTAGNVTTNANLTGVITSVGNATSIASQTGTGTKFVVDNTPTLITPILGVAKATSINTGTTLNGVVFIKSANAISLISTDHAATIGNEASGLNLVAGLYSSVLGIQGRNNGVAANIFLQPLGAGVSVGDGSMTGQRILAVNNTGSGTGDYASIEVRNGAAGTGALRLWCPGTGFTTSGSNVQNSAVVTAGTGLTGGMSLGTLANAVLRIYTNNIQRIVVDGSGHTLFSARVELSKGANVASAGDLTLGSAGNSFSITGTTTINAITTTSWQSGSVIRLIFAASVTVKNNTAGGAGTAKMLLNGGVDFAATANDVLTLIYDGTNWLECSRSIN